MRFSEPQLTRVDPISALKILSVVRDFTNYDIEALKSGKDLKTIIEDPKYTLEEKYLILKNILTHLDLKNKNSLANKKIKEFEALGNSEAFEALDKLTDYYNSICKSCKSQLIMTKRHYQKSLKFDSKIDNFNESERDTKFYELGEWERLPLIYKKHEFISFFHQELGNFFSEDQINGILNNSFDYTIEQPSIRLLAIEYEDSAGVHRAFHRIYKKYKERREILKDKAISHSVKKSKSKERKKEDLKFSRNDFMQKINEKHYIKATNKINFAIIMFLSFKKIRENYLNNCDDNKSIQKFFQSLSCNIKC
ncbi:hypothetical protein LZZ90_00520 [Flavobacterium sp. SM15]|uniref:hypothetical protein n=1 Tax=Flavobacterium sp. SM15 TaxID=2908005 RepID=UPI001EDC4A09|nr:hypothetical protein [Flavobacterium sp. SM15]MCG2609985.1 hypothetical protein [Flavobacterium sp. SM15]